MPANKKVLAATKKKPDRSKKVAKKKIPSQRQLCLYPTSKVEEDLVAVQNGMSLSQASKKYFVPRTTLLHEKKRVETLTEETRKKGSLSAQKIVKLKNKDFFFQIWRCHLWVMCLFMCWVYCLTSSSFRKKIIYRFEQILQILIFHALELRDWGGHNWSIGWPHYGHMCPQPVKSHFSYFYNIFQ